MKDALGPLDGRYFKQTRQLAKYFSEEALMKYRVMIEAEYFLALSSLKITKIGSLSQKEINLLRDLYNKFTGYSFKNIKKFEEKTNHDLKAVEYYIKSKLSSTSLANKTEWVHFGLTSEDTNNISYALILSDSLDGVIKPAISEIIFTLDALAKKYKNSPMLARTHGQPASPTTFGKEMKVFSARLKSQLAILNKIKISAKLNGATGNFNAHIAAYPKTNWPAFSKKFIEGFNLNRTQKLQANMFTTQTESHDSYVEIFDCLRRINTILLDFSQDLWRYISDEWITQKLNPREIGSSTMPHKVNPIDFENCEGNLGLANTLFEFFGRKLPISRLQRDLSDSTVKRSIGSAFGYSFLAYSSLQKGLDKIFINENKMKEALTLHPEIIGEAIQTILRREGIEAPYEQLRSLTRGKDATIQDIYDFINTLDINYGLKKELLSFTPHTYLGLASKLA